MCLKGAYQRIGLFVDEDVAQAIKQAISTQGSLVELSLSEVENGGVLTLSTIISPDFSKSFNDYSDVAMTKASVKNMAVAELKDDKEIDNLDDYEWEVNIDDYI